MGQIAGQNRPTQDPEVAQYLAFLRKSLDEGKTGLDPRAYALELTKLGPQALLKQMLSGAYQSPDNNYSMGEQYFQLAQDPLWGERLPTMDKLYNKLSKIYGAQ